MNNSIRGILAISLAAFVVSPPAGGSWTALSGADASRLTGTVGHRCTENAEENEPCYRCKIGNMICKLGKIEKFEDGKLVSSETGFGLVPPDGKKPTGHPGCSVSGISKPKCVECPTCGEECDKDGQPATCGTEEPLKCENVAKKGKPEKIKPKCLETENKCPNKC